MALPFPQTTSDQDPENPLAISKIDRANPIVVYLPDGGNNSSDFSIKTPDKARGLIHPGKAVQVTLNNGDVYYALLDANGNVIATAVDEQGNTVPATTLGDKVDTDAEQAKRFTAEKKERDRLAAEAARVARSEEGQAERKITNVAIVKENGKYIKRTTYEKGSPKDEEVNSETSISTVDIAGKKFLIQTIKNPDGTFSPPTYTDLSTGQAVATLPVDPDKGPKPTTHFVKDGNGRTIAVTVGADGQFQGAKDTGLAAETKNTQTTVEYPDGTKHIINIDQNGKATEVFSTPAAPAPPAESGSFIPDPRKPAMGLGDHVQTLANLRAAGKITDKQYEDLKTSAYNIALAEAKRLDTVVSAQRSATQDAITQRSNDLQAASGRLTYAGKATQDAYDTAIKIAQSVNGKALRANKDAAGGSILASIMGVQDARAAQSGGYFQPPTVTPQAGTAYGEITQWGTNAGAAPGVSPVNPPPGTAKPAGPVTPPASANPPSGDRQVGNPATRPPVAPVTGVGPAPGPAQPRIRFRNKATGEVKEMTPAELDAQPDLANWAPDTANANTPSEPNPNASPVAPSDPGVSTPDGGDPRGIAAPSAPVSPPAAPTADNPNPPMPEDMGDAGRTPVTERTTSSDADPLIFVRSTRNGEIKQMRRSEFDAQPKDNGAEVHGWEEIPSMPAESLGVPDFSSNGSPDNASPQPSAATPEEPFVIVRAGSGNQLGTKYFKLPRRVYDLQPQTWKDAHPIERESSPQSSDQSSSSPSGTGVSAESKSVDPNWLASTNPTPKPVADPFSWFTPNNNTQNNQPWNQWAPQIAQDRAYAEREQAQQRGVATPTPGQWFTPGAPSPAGPVGMTPPIQPVAQMNPRVAMLQQKYADDPEMLDALMQAQAMG